MYNTLPKQVPRQHAETFAEINHKCHQIQSRNAWAPAKTTKEKIIFDPFDVIRVYTNMPRGDRIEKIQFRLERFAEKSRTYKSRFYHWDFEIYISKLLFHFIAHTVVKTA